jgi:hypothetical protein
MGLVVSTMDGDPGDQYVLEVHVRGVLHIQVERMPRWLWPMVMSAVMSAVSALSTWLAIR